MELTRSSVLEAYACIPLSGPSKLLSPTQKGPEQKRGYTGIDELHRELQQRETSRIKREKEREVMLDVGDVIPGLAGPDCVTEGTLQGSGLHPGSPARGELSLQKKKVMHAGESAVIFTAQRSRTKAFLGKCARVACMMWFVPSLPELWEAHFTEKGDVDPPGSRLHGPCSARLGGPPGGAVGYPRAARMMTIYIYLIFWSVLRPGGPFSHVKALFF